MFSGTSRERCPLEMNDSTLHHFVSEGAMKAEINAHRYIVWQTQAALVWYQGGLSSRSD